MIYEFVYKHWRWFRATPFVIVLLLLVFNVAVPDEIAEEATAILWFGVAIGSLICAEGVRLRMREIRTIAREDYPAGSEERETAESNYSLALKLVVVHIVFALVGFAAAFLPDSQLRVVISRDLLLMGQWLLLIIVLHTYLFGKALENRMDRQKDTTWGEEG